MPAIMVFGPRRVRRLVVAVLAALVTLGIAYGPREPIAPAVVSSGIVAATPDRPLRIAYDTAPDCFGELYLPRTGHGPFPVVVLIHGGGWSQNRTLTQFDAQSSALAENGVAVWNIEYRRVNGAGGWPVTLTDVADAVLALATTVQQQSGNALDLQRIQVAGHSAGGHLAAWVAGRFQRSPEPKALRIRSATLMSAVLDPEYAVTKGRDGFVRKLLGGSPSEVPERYRYASPIAHLPTGIRITALHGDADTVVAPEQSRRYVNAARRAGNSADLRLLPGTGHGEFADATSSAWALAQQVILDHAETVR
ncbi:alpha/beta hydrolase [Nocardia brasiliensis]|uniref:alpha/beta hydrolase family protein n=1 Tax=Nocardia brasiliensis TaxID=37326 RepID=UPI002B4B1A58|nr:alpha/beta hydrolase [Nocardia brasiliensis]